MHFCQKTYLQILAIFETIQAFNTLEIEMKYMYDSMLAICWILDPVQNSNFSCTELNTFNGDTKLMI